MSVLTFGGQRMHLASARSRSNLLIPEDSVKRKSRVSLPLAYQPLPLWITI